VGVSPQSPGSHQAVTVMTLSRSYSPMIPNNTSLSSYLNTLFGVVVVADPHLVVMVAGIYQLGVNHSMVITSVTLKQTRLSIRWLKMAAATMSSLA
jgi:hypothetical protein